MLKTIYNYSPACFQDLFLTLQAYIYRRQRKGRIYKNLLKSFQSTQYFSLDEIKKWQIQQFKTLFREATNSTVYYNNVFNNSKLDFNKINDFSFLKNIPVLTKEILTNNPEDFINSNRKIVYVSRTGGTTGAPMATPYDKESLQWATALMYRFFEQCGVKYGSRNLHMTGQQVVPLSEKRKFWRYDFIGKSLFLSIHHLNKTNFPKYWERVLKHKPLYIFGYTSFIYDFSRFVNENNLSGQLKLKGVFPSSEKLTNEMENEIIKAFDCKVFDHYGATEGIPLITQCKNKTYHIVPESGIIEFIKPDGSYASPGEPAEMYMTSLRQFSRPILRYKIGDTGIYSNKSCSCGLNWQVVTELTGRLAEWVTLRDGKRISQFSHQVFKMVTNVKSSQIIQLSFTKFEVKIVKGASYSAKDEALIKKRFDELISDDVDVTFIYLNEIPRTKGGKRPSLISKVKK